MARELPKVEPETDDGEIIREFIQFRGRQTSVVLDDFGIRFQMMEKETPEGGFQMHEPLPVASEEAIRAGEAPANAVAAEVAEELAHGELSNPLVQFGVVCEHPTEEGICGKVFPSLKSLNGHLSSHYSDADDENQRDADSSASGTEADTETGDQE
jgi:hypothetical protein